MSFEAVIARQRGIYGQRFRQYGDAPESTFQNDRQTQFLRYERLFASFPPSNRTLAVHDVGCGLCDLHQYLIEQRIAHEYIGTDVVPEMVAAARQKYPNIAVSCRDLLASSEVKTSDIVVASGIFNLPAGTPREEWVAFMQAMIVRMFALARVGIAFNVLTTFNTFSTPELHYVNPLEIMEFCLTHLSRFVVVDHAYPLFEATLTVLTEEYVRAGANGPELAKYFAPDATA